MQANFNALRSDIKDLYAMKDQFEENDVHYILCGMDGCTGELVSAFTTEPEKLKYMLNWMLLFLSRLLKVDDKDEFIDSVRDNFTEFIYMYENGMDLGDRY